MQLLISCKVADGDWKLDSLMEAIEAEVSARERIGIDQSRPPPRRRDSPPSATSLVSGGTSSISSPCCYCNKLHLLINCDTLALPVDSKKYLSIAAFGSRKGRPKQCEVVQLAVRTKHGGSQALVVPYICNPVTSEATCIAISLSWT